MLIEEDYLLIEAYLDGSLNETEVDDFEKRLSKEEDLHNEYLAQKSLINSLKDHEKAQLKNELKSAISENLVIQKRNKKPIYYAIAASVVLIVSTVSYFTWQNDSTSTKAIFNTYFEPYPIQPNVRANDSLSLGIVLYQNEEFSSALPVITKLGNLNNPDNEYNLAIASAYLVLEQPKKAIPWIESVTKSNDKLLQYYAEWYLALAYTQTDVDSAKELLLKISNSENPYKKEAEAVLQIID